MKTPRESEVYASVRNGDMEIDSLGRVWRVRRRTGIGRAGGAISRPCARKRAENDVGEYLHVRCMIDGKRYHTQAGRLVWHHFNGPIPVMLVVNHKNGIKKDNRPENLEIVTYSGNSKHAVHVLKINNHLLYQPGAKNAMAKLSEEDVCVIRRRRSAGEKLLAIAKDYGVAFQTISRIARGNRWGHTTSPR